jgi:hypothetical protein
VKHLLNDKVLRDNYGIMMKEPRALGLSVDQKGEKKGKARFQIHKE